VALRALGGILHLPAGQVADGGENAQELDPVF
jgi:hypothetical protein